MWPTIFFRAEDLDARGSGTVACKLSVKALASSLGPIFEILSVKSLLEKRTRSCRARPVSFIDLAASSFWQRGV
jgi:hypothetical protein